MSGDKKLLRCVIRSPTTKGWPDGVGLENADEALAEHERLELQGRIEQPEEAEDDLEHPLGAHDEGEPVRRQRLGPRLGVEVDVFGVLGVLVLERHHARSYANGLPRDGPVGSEGRVGPDVGPAALRAGWAVRVSGLVFRVRRRRIRGQASATAASSFCRVSLASPKSMVVLGS